MALIRLRDWAYAQADMRLCWSHIPHCWKSHVAAHMLHIFMYSVHICMFRSVVFEGVFSTALLINA